MSDFLPVLSWAVGAPLNYVGFWSAVDWLFCRDGKWRPVEPAPVSLADGVPSVVVPGGPLIPASFPLKIKGEEPDHRATRLRGYGNAIVPQVGAVFIRTVLEALDGK